MNQIQFGSAAAADECQDNQRRIFPASRVMFCARCGHATSGGYGHYESYCRRDHSVHEPHHCCPVSCALVDGRDMDRTAPCHPAPGTYQQWAAKFDREMSATQPWRGGKESQP